MARRKKPNIFTSIKRGFDKAKSGINKGISKAKSGISKGTNLIKDYNNKLNEKDKIIRQKNGIIVDKEFEIENKNYSIKYLKKRLDGPLLDMPGNEVSQPRFKFIPIKKCDNCRESFQQMDSKDKTPVIEPMADQVFPLNDPNYPIQYNWNSGLEAKSNAYSTLYNTYFYGYQNAVDLIQNQLEPEIKHLNLTNLTGLQYSYTSVKNENNLIKQQIQENKNNYSTDNRLFDYQTNNLTYLKSINFIIFIIYYCIFIFFLYFMVFKKTSDIQYKIILTVLFLLYPFIIKPIEEFIYFIFVFFVSTIFGNVYVAQDD